MRSRHQAFGPIVTGTGSVRERAPIEAAARLVTLRIHRQWMATWAAPAPTSVAPDQVCMRSHVVLENSSIGSQATLRPP